MHPLPETPDKIAMKLVPVWIYKFKVSKNLTVIGEFGPIELKFGDFGYGIFEKSDGI